MQNVPDTLFTADQVREMDRVAIEEQGISGFELMHRAGTAVFEQIRLRWPAERRLLVFCGAGNNAGDGYVVATLALKAGYRVSVFSLADTQRLHGDALTACQAFRNSGGRIDSFRADVLLKPCVIVDALLGTGLDKARPVSGGFATAIDAINASGNPVIAVDIPSGLHADSGRALGCAAKASTTVTFIALKQGLFTADAAEYCGDIVFDDLAVPDSVMAALKPSARLLGKPSVPRRHRCAHKGDHGHVLVVGGDHGFSGAVRLAAEAALRSGAGLVSVATRAVHSSVIGSDRPEIMSHGVETCEQLTVLLERASVVVIGPGLGQSAWARAMFDAIRSSDLKCVVDADALNLLAKSPERKDNWVITPHPGEAARLLRMSTAEINGDRFAAVSQLQRRFAGVALLKGAGSLIQDDHAVYVSTTGNPGMASGGMGDVLSGIIGGLLAQGMGPSTATQSAVYVHGEAADVAAARDGERGLLASDLLSDIRKLLNS